MMSIMTTASTFREPRRRWTGQY